MPARQLSIVAVIGPQQVREYAREDPSDLQRILGLHKSDIQVLKRRTTRRDGREVVSPSGVANIIDRCERVTPGVDGQGEDLQGRTVLGEGVQAVERGLVVERGEVALKGGLRIVFVLVEVEPFETRPRARHRVERVIAEHDDRRRLECDVGDGWQRGQGREGGVEIAWLAQPACVRERTQRLTGRMG